MYKDKDKQREANREASQRRRDKGMTKGMTNQGMTVEDERSNEPSNVIPKGVTDKALLRFNVGEASERILPSDKDSVYSQKDIKPERTAQGNIRVSKPGDDDYVPQCETTMVFVGGKNWVDELGRSLTRGKDIKCFADLPPDVQRTIDRLSLVDGKIDQTVKANRTAIAVSYQHLFPDKYYPQDAVTLQQYLHT
ncbi:hypothetical protein LCGC14_2461940 [marine sediment metagenome]|uniref:Uncharacterized protein n=1 Tax=marine sediment metagenome TaxID=412755 RepID=A0A0F9DQ51_9ZZZZ